LDHYRSFRVLIDDTKRVRITDSVSWHPRDEQFRRRSVTDDQQRVPHARVIVSTVTKTGQPEKTKAKPQILSRVFKFAGVAKSYKSACKGPDQDRWLLAADEEFDRLIETTETMKFVPWNTKPKERKASYYNPQIRIKTKGDGSTEYRVRGTYGGDISDYQGPTAAQTADMMSIKILLNATVSEGAKFMSMDIKDFYLGTPMEQKEYMRIHLSQIPPSPGGSTSARA
jgi:hypothetical protein